ncbi:MAG: hypothetical protein M1821_002660 [Bathelium mastoideum]|nr:MAG: hypothetical protein M1821_002660 [Bathelium mastoideum]
MSLTQAGPFVRFGPNRVSVNTAEGLMKIYGGSANTQKSTYYHVFNDVFKGDSSLTTVDHDTHARKKRVVSSALSDSSVRSMEELVLRNIRKFTERLGEASQLLSTSAEPEDPENAEWSSPKDMTAWADYLSFDIMGDICFSGSFEMLDKEDNRYILEALSEGVNGLNMTGWMPWLLRLKIGNLLFPKLNKDMKRYEAFARKQSMRRLKMGVHTIARDVYSYLLQANEASKESQPLFTPEDLVGESSLLITSGESSYQTFFLGFNKSGSDTTATAISATLFYLVHNPEALRKLQQEIRPLFAEVEDIC